VFGADERVRAMWLHGALARGRGSDMDISVAIAEEHGFDGFAVFFREAPPITRRATEANRLPTAHNCWPARFHTGS